MSHRKAWHAVAYKCLPGVLTLLYPVVIYTGLQYSTPQAMALVLAGLAAVRALTARHRGRAALLLLSGALALLALISGESLPLKLYPVLVNGAMLALFGWSLRRPPNVVERIARLREPALPPFAVAYTRSVTKAWCLFFVCNGVVAALTAWLATDRVWALYNGVIAYVLIGAMFAGEWLVRRRVRMRHGGHGNVYE